MHTIEKKRIATIPEHLTSLFKMTNDLPGKYWRFRVFLTLKGALLLCFLHSFAGCLPSFLVEGTEQPHENPSWAKEAVFYQVFVRSFYDGSGDGTGDFEGLKKKIPYFKELGVSGLWLMPVTKGESYHGYDVIDYYAVEPDYGSLEDFQAFLEKAHRHDLKVIVDFVANHTSTSHPWFIEASKGADNPYYDYYIWTEEPEESHLDREKFRPLLETDRFYYAHYAYHMPDLNYHNPEVRQEIKEIARFWLKKGVDGFRLDGANVIDPDRDFTVGWWQEFNAFVKKVEPSAFVVGENWYHLSEDIAPYYEALESSFNFVMAEEMYKMALGSKIPVVEKIQEIHELYTSHAASNPASLFVDSTMVSNHDMDRIASRLGENEDKIKLAGSLLLTLPGTPYIYYGQELGQAGQSTDPNRREPFPWFEDLSGEGMTEMTDHYEEPLRYLHPSDGISLQEQKEKKESIYNHYRRLIEIRNDYPAFFYSRNYNHYPVSAGSYSYTVSSENNDYSLLVIHNVFEKEKKLTVQHGPVRELLGDYTVSTDDELLIEPYHSAVLKYEQKPPFPEKKDYVLPLYTSTFKVKVPEDTPPEADVYMSADVNQWNPQDEEYRLQRKDNYYTLSVDFPRHYLVQFKFTRGCWDTREQNEAGEDVVGADQQENRQHIFRTNGETIVLEIERWADK